MGEKSDLADGICKLADNCLKAREERDALREQVKLLSSFIVRKVEPFEETFWGGDHACERCHPNSDLLIEGFVCAYHQAVDIQAALKGGDDGS